MIIHAGRIMAPCGRPSGPGSWAFRVNFACTEFSPSIFPKLPGRAENVHLAGALQLHACYATPVTLPGEGLTPFLFHSRRKVEEMRTTVLVLAPTTLALLLTRGAALLNAAKSAEATFPGQNGNTMKFAKRGVSEGTCLLSSRYARVIYRP
jgi:hypothetical protein